MTGKRLPLFLVAAAVLLFLRESLICQTISDYLYRALSIPDIEIITFDDLNHKSSCICSGYNFSSILSKKIDGKTVVNSSLNSPFANLFLLNTTETNTHAFALKAAYNTIELSNSGDRTAAEALVSGTGYDLSFRWATTRGIGLFGMGFDRRESSTDLETQIKHFPVSENSRMADYFLNLMEPTFGRMQNGNLETKALQVTAWGSTPLNDSRRLLLTVSHLESDRNLQLAYLNKSEYEDLNGDREADAKFQYRETYIDLSLNISNSYINDLCFGSLTQNIEYSTDNNRLHLTDAEDLGEGKLTSSGFHMKAQHLGDGYSLYLGFANTFFSADFCVNTPTLGYIILPIIHSADGKISDGSSFSQIIGGRYNLNIKRIKNAFSLSYTHARYWFEITGKADLMLGIASTPIDYPILMDMNIFDLCYKLSIPLGRFAIEYRLDQIVPLIKRLDDSPVRTKMKIPDLDVSYRGGLSHMITLSAPL